MARSIRAVQGLALLAVIGVAAGRGVLAQDLPRPADILGFEPGLDRKLADWATLVRYFDDLDKASPRVEITRIGKTTLGREMVLVAISSAENIRRRAEIQISARRLADPRGLSPEEARQISQEARLVLFVSANIHSDEVASTLMAPKLAYWLASSQSDEALAILENVVVLVVPSMNPDGLDLVVDWYRETLDTPFEGAEMPWLYHPYAGHDNNRDWFMLNLVETRHVTRLLYKEWFPRILVDVHQMGAKGPRFFVPPYVDPLNPNVDPLLVAESNYFGTRMALDLAASGLKGVVHGVTFDGYWGGGVRNAPLRHNIVGILTEAASARLASPLFLEGKDLEGPSKSSSAHVQRVRYPDPWTGGWWRIGDIIEYEMCALRSVLSLAATERRTFLWNGYLLAARAVARGVEAPPYAYVFPAEQADLATVRKLFGILDAGGVEIHRAKAAFEADGMEFPAGSHVVLMAQPYRAHAKDLLEIQEYPEVPAEGAEGLARPYDIAGWTLPLQMGVESVEIRHPFTAGLERVDLLAAELPIELPSAAAGWVLPARANVSYRVASDLVAAGVRTARVTELANPAPPAVALGDFWVAAGEPGVREKLSTLLSGSGLVPLAVDRVDGLVFQDLRAVRLGIYQPWTANIDEGWTRFVLDELHFPYSVVHDSRIRAGNLQRDFDCLIFPSMPGSEILSGRSRESTPPRYVGGIGKRGLANLTRFVETGGRIVLLSKSGELALARAKEKVTSALAPPEEKHGEEGAKEKPAFACPGSILRGMVQTGHPLSWGYSEETALFFADGPAYSVSEPATSVVSYPADSILLSGWIDGESVLAGRSALVDFPDGKGRWVLFGFRPQHRGQTHGTFRFLANAILDPR